MPILKDILTIALLMRYGKARNKESTGVAIYKLPSEIRHLMNENVNMLKTSHNMDRLSQLNDGS